MPFARSVAIVGAIVCVAALATAPAAAAMPAPIVTRLSNTSGPTAGGERLNVTGTGFTHVTAISFGRARGTGLRVASTRSLSVVVPAHAAEQLDVRIIQMSGASTKVVADHFTFVAPPAISSLSLTQGSIAGGTRLTVDGSNFASVQSVDFGSKTGAALQVISTHELTITAPAHAADTVPVRVHTAYGVSPVTRNTFTYVVPGQDPVSDLAVIDTTETSDRLSWQLPATGAPTSLDVRRADGPTPPATPTDGDPVTVSPSDTAVTDTGLSAASEYSYAVFAEDAAGDVSPPADITATTAGTARPAAPANPEMAP